MSEIKIRISFNDHPCTNVTEGRFTLPDPDCRECSECMCEAGASCCGSHWESGTYCPDCGSELDFPYCYTCNGDSHDCGETIDEGEDVLYTGEVFARWVNGELAEYRGYGHPHLSGTYCLGGEGLADMFMGVHAREKAIEAIVTHISNVNFFDGLEPATQWHGIRSAS